jgi:hypothetical protein
VGPSAGLEAVKRTSLARKLHAATKPSGSVDEKKNSCTCWDSNPNRPACSQFPYWGGGGSINDVTHTWSNLMESL